MAILAQLQNHINAAATQLKVDVPKMIFVPFIISDRTGMHIIFDENAYENNLNYRPEINYVLGYFPDGSEKIYLATHNPLTGEPFPEAEVLFSALHELRHAWQKRYESKIFYKRHAVGLECIDDISEVDADAFALAYLSYRTIYNPDRYMGNLSLYMQNDNGAREARTKEIAETYFKKERRE